MKVLGLVFTEGVSLETWVKQGLIFREKRIYEEHLRQGHFDKIIWFTYGKKDAEIRKELVEQGSLDERIQVVPMPLYFSGKYMTIIYSYLLPYIQKKYCNEISIIKTNQMGGAWTAYLMHRLYRIPFILRTGYTYSSYLKNKKEQEHSIYKKWKANFEYKKYVAIEKKLYHKCDAAFVSSRHDKEYVCNSYGIQQSKINILTNYIDCELFKPKEVVNKQEKRVVFVGRLSQVKNLFHIIQAVGELGWGLDIYGNGELKERLEEFAENKGFDVHFCGIVANAKLPAIYNQYKYYILASLSEGMPKTLLEAMACGLICFGTDIPGIREIIADGENGYLIADTSAEMIKNALIRGINNVNNEKVSRCAVDYIQENHLLREIVTKEWNVIQNL
ncbi:MAG: glycosyltransferase family 4 protein [Lachnospiraceae bacterium]|nr:glycosyltransferase family 4 protein [Lachnospiraceae bacterium]